MPDLSSARTAPIAPVPAFSGSVTLTPADAATRFILRGTGTAEAVGAAFGVTPPTLPCRAAASGERAALWLGPDEWLLIAPSDETSQLQQALEAALAGIPHALVDISHRQTALLLDGADAGTVLNAGTPLDLSLAAYPVGMTTRTIFEKAEIVLWRTAIESFRIEVWRSFAPYVLALLSTAARELGDGA